MAFLAVRTITIAAGEGEFVAAMGFELTRLTTATDEGAATVGAGRTASGFGLPVGGLTSERQILELTRAADTSADRALARFQLRWHWDAVSATRAYHSRYPH